MKVINRTREQVTLQIVLANGTKDSINLQPQARATLPPGATLDPAKKVVYDRIVKTVEDAAPPATSPAVTTPGNESATGGSVTLSETAGQ